MITELGFVGTGLMGSPMHGEEPERTDLGN